MGILQRKKRRRVADTGKQPVFASAQALELATEANLLNAGLIGTGKNGAITVADVRKAIAAQDEEE